MFKNLGKTEIKINSIIMGCWQLGGLPHWQNIQDIISKKAILASVNMGILTFDTAPGYGNGHSEQLLGSVLKECRKKVIIATKVFSDKLDYKQVVDSCEHSLRNLQTDYIDLLQVHFPSGSFDSTPIPIEETMKAFQQLKDNGKIRAIGVSNFSLSQLCEACKYAEIASVQPPYSLFWRKSFDEIISYCEKNDISILAYSHLAQGLLTGKFGRNHLFPENEVRSKQILCQPDHFARVQNALDELRPIAKKNKMTLTELALVWLTAQPKTSAIVGIRTPGQAVHNAGVIRLSLSQDDLDKINKIGQGVTQYLNNDSLMWNFN